MWETAEALAPPVDRKRVIYVGRGVTRKWTDFLCVLSLEQSIIRNGGVRMLFASLLDGMTVSSRQKTYCRK